MEEKELEQWKKAIEDAIDFAQIHLLWFLSVDYNAGKIEDVYLTDLSETDLVEYNRLKGILGEHAIAYLVSKDVDSIPPSSGEKAEKLQKELEEEYKRIKTLTPEQFQEEVEKEVAAWKKE